MSTLIEHNPPTRLALPLQAVLAQLRRSIRAYVWADALAMVLVVLGVCFWTSLAFDWLFEPPAAVRVGVLAAAGLALAWVLVRYVARRAFVPLADRSMAVLLERHFHQFQDSLLTTVELAAAPEHALEFNPEMLLHTQDEALARAEQLRLKRVFNWRPLAKRAAAGVLLTLSILVFSVAASEALGTWARRSLLFSSELWPRKTRLIVEGLGADGRVKLARGADFELGVKADAAPDREVPEVVEVRYVQGGARGRENMSRSGHAVPGVGEFQSYNYTFKDVLAPVEFYVRGGDDRQGPYRLEVVDSPTVGQMILHCEYPAYMKRAARAIPVAGAMQLPRGTRVTIEARTNKDVLQVQVDDLVDEQTAITHKLDLSGAAGQRDFSYVIDSLDGDKVLRFTLLDTDGIRSRDPVRLSLAALPDEAPQVNVVLRGIGSAITAKARLPMGGEIADDYGIAAAWFEFHVDDDAPRRQDFAASAEGQDKLPVNEALEVESLSLVPKQKLHLAVQAADTYALAAAPNLGTSQRYVLDVVTPAQLRSMLEARELLLRRRFETIIQEVTENRDALVRMDFGHTAAPGERPAEPAAKGLVEPGDEPEADAAGADAAGAAAGAGGVRNEDSQAAAERRMALVRVHAERALQNSQRSADETLGVATSFDAICEELVNNRVDTEELKARLKDGIAAPLKRISGEMFPELERRLRTLQGRLADPAAGTAAAESAREQADAILVEMNLVLGKMVELETFNEVLDILRGIINSQENINERTRQKQKEKLRSLLDEED